MHGLVHVSFADEPVIWKQMIGFLQVMNQLSVFLLMIGLEHVI